MKKIITPQLILIVGCWLLFIIFSFLLFGQGTNTPSISSFAFLGVPVIVSCVYSVRGRIKRSAYFFSLCGLLFLLSLLGSLFSASSFFSKFLTVIVSFTGSFLLASILMLMIFVIGITDFIRDILNLESMPLIIIRSLIMIFLISSTYYLFIALKIKRLRDINLSGWFSLITLVPGINVLFEIFLCLKSSAKKPRKK